MKEDDVSALKQENALLRSQLSEATTALNDTREELAIALKDWNAIIKALGLRHHGTAIARAALIKQRADACTCQPQGDQPHIQPKSH